jgi:hypothetical protein
MPEKSPEQSKEARIAELEHHLNALKAWGSQGARHPDDAELIRKLEEEIRKVKGETQE